MEEDERHSDYFVTVIEYGTKVAGLRILPPQWVPPYAALPASLYELWSQQPTDWVRQASKAGVDLKRTLELVSGDGRYQIILRSSAVGEGLNDRGKYKSIALKKGVGAAEFIKSVEDIYGQFSAHHEHVAIGICIQRYMEAELAGHVSNEVHVSATRNQWKYGIEVPSYAPDKGINSKFASPPEEAEPVIVHGQRDLQPALRRICYWVNLRVDVRSHMEWCVAGNRLWVVQIDQESPTSSGINPHSMPTLRAGPSTIENQPTATFSVYRVQDDPAWRKLRNIRDFWVDDIPPRHRLFYATAATLKPKLRNRDTQASLANEIDVLTGGRAVLRTDCNKPGFKAFNLPRTHTVNGEYAASWLIDKIADLESKGVPDENLLFILHQYIPARAAAWSYYSLEDDYVLIDCLWGLPDGLQFLSHDSFQVDARSGKELAAEVRYKRDFLQEQEDGTWRYVGIARQFGRDRVLSSEALRHIALATVRIAKHVHERAQIMWFCDIPPELGLGEHLPWYRSKDFALHERVERPPVPSRVVRTVADLEETDRQHGRFIIRVEPEVDLVRDDEGFLDSVIEIARKHDAPVELAGSILGHAYYKLRDAGVLVLTPQPRYQRVRGKQVHRKIVRDSIPENIAAKGERVTFARLAAGEAIVALIGKMFEEGVELSAANGADNQTEELADVLEVVRGLATVAGISWERLVSVADDKRQKRGGFENQTVLLQTGRPMPSARSQPRMQSGESEPGVTLREIGIISVSEGSAVVPFARLLSRRKGLIEIPMGARRIAASIELSGSGIVLRLAEVVRPVEQFDGQPDLFDGIASTARSGAQSK